MTTTETAPVKWTGVDEVRAWVDTLKPGTKFARAVAIAALPHLSEAQVTAALRSLRAEGKLSHNGKLSGAGRYTKPKTSSAPAQRQAEPEVVTEQLPEIIEPPMTEIVRASGGTTVYIPDNLPADGEWREVFHLSPNYEVHVDTLVDGSKVLFIRRNP
jgi:DNA-binding transcriptional MocR family regulator